MESDEVPMDTQTSSASGLSNDSIALKMQVSLLKKAQDIASEQVQALLPQPARSANMATQGRNIDVSA